MTKRGRPTAAALMTAGLVLITCCISAPSLGAGRADTIRQQLDTATGTERVDLLNELSTLYFRKSPETSVAHATDARQLAEQMGYNRGSAGATANLAMNAYLVADHQRALDLFDEASRTFEALGDEVSIGRIWYTRGVIYRDLGNMPESFDNFHKALEARRELGDKRGMAFTYNGLGANYRLLSDYDKALEYFLLSLELKEELGETGSIATTLHNIGLTYKNLEEYELAIEHLTRSLELKTQRDDKRGASITLAALGNVERALGDESGAMKRYEEALALQEAIDYRDGIASTHNNIGQLYRERGDYPRAAEYYRKAITQFEESGKKNSLANALNNLGYVSLKMGDTERAGEYLPLALAIAREVGGNNLLQNSYEILAELHEQQGNYELALQNYRLFAEERNTIFGKEMSSRIAAMQARYDLGQKQAEIVQLRTENMASQARLETQRVVRNSLGAGLLGLLVAATVIALMYRKQLAASRVIDLKNEALEEALGEIETLRGLVPICSWCKKIRDERGTWHQPEVYISAHSEANFSHGICPECSKATLAETDNGSS